MPAFQSFRIAATAAAAIAIVCGGSGSAWAQGAVEPAATHWNRLDCAANLLFQDLAAAVEDAENIRLADGRELNLGIHALRLDDRRTIEALKELTENRTIAILWPDTPPPPPNSHLHRARPPGSVTPSPDRYGRTSGYTLASAPSPAWLQARLIEQGLARAELPLTNPDPCFGELLALEERARRLRVGYWGTGAFEVLQATDLDTLAAREGRFAIVEGTVTRASNNKARQYLNFGTDWRQDFTVAISAGTTRRRASQYSDKPALNLHSRAPAFRKGQRIRVRGFVEVRNGPLIRVRRIQQIERLD